MLVSAKSSSSSSSKRTRLSSTASLQAGTPPPSGPIPPRPPSPSAAAEHESYLDDDFLCPSPELLPLHCYQPPPPMPPVQQQEGNGYGCLLVEEEPSHAPALCRALGEMMRKNEFCDLTLVTQTSTIPVHVCVVAACSRVVRNYLKQSPVKHLRLANLPGLTELQKRALNDEFAVRNLMCDYAYFGHFSAQVTASASAVCMLDDDDGVGAMERIIRLLAGALGLAITGAVNVATNMLKSRIDVANGLLIYSAGWDLGCAELERSAETFVDANFSLVCLEQSWIDASDNLVSRILCRDELTTNAGEMEVFRAIVRWGFEDFASRAVMAEAMLSNPRIFRLQWLTDADLAELYRDEALEHFSPEVKKLVEFEAERRRSGILPEVSIPCRVLNASSSATAAATAAAAAATFPPSPLFSMDLEQGSPRLATAAAAASTMTTTNLALPNAIQQSRQIFQSVRVLSGHEKAVCSLTANERWIVSGSQDHTIRVWDVATSSTRTILRGHQDSVSVLRFFPNRQLISGSFDRSIRVWEEGANGTAAWKSCGFVAQVAHEDPITCLTVVTRTKQLASGTSGGEIKIWSLNEKDGGSWQLHFMLQNAHAHVLWSCCEWGNALVTGSSDTEIRVWDSSTWELKRRLQFHKDEVQALFVIGDELYSGSDDGVINVYRANVERPVRGTSLGRAIMAFSELDSNLVVGLGDGGILLLRAQDLTLVAELKSHASSVMALCVVKRHLVSGSFDKTVRVWEAGSKIV